MGRRSTGSMTINGVPKIELGWLLHNGYIKKGQNIFGSLRWTNDNSIRIETNYTDEKYIRLIYTNTNICTNEKTEHDYKIYFHEVPSNLGKGNVLYFICPSDGHYCRVLYKCYGSLIWKSRLAYQSRIYYSSQVSSKLSYYNDRFWSVDHQLEDLYKKPIKTHYRGKKTRLQQRIERMENLQNYYDEMRWTILPKWFQKMIYSTLNQ
jgi:hypothetical protein